jgi:general stress protein 26
MSALESMIAGEFRNPQFASLATITEDGLPWTRYVMIVGDNDLTLRCATLVTARKVDQVERNPEVHLSCGIMNPMDMKPCY